jgi:hypothetical protein
VLWIVAVGLALYVISVMLKPGPAGDGLPANPLGIEAADRLLGPIAAVSGLSVRRVRGPGARLAGGAFSPGPG